MNFLPFLGDYCQHDIKCNENRDTPDTKHQSKERTNTLKLKEAKRFIQSFIHSFIHSFTLNETTRPKKNDRKIEHTHRRRRKKTIYRNVIIMEKTDKRTTQSVENSEAAKCLPQCLAIIIGKWRFTFFSTPTQCFLHFSLLYGNSLLLCSYICSFVHSFAH